MLRFDEKSISNVLHKKYPISVIKSLWTDVYSLILALLWEPCESSNHVWNKCYNSYKGLVLFFPYNIEDFWKNTDWVLTDNMNDVIYWVDLVRNMIGICIAGVMHIAFLPNTYVTKKILHQVTDYWDLNYRSLSQFSFSFSS